LADVCLARDRAAMVIDDADHRDGPGGSRRSPDGGRDGLLHGPPPGRGAADLEARTSRVALGRLTIDLLVALTARRIRRSPTAMLASSLLARARTY